MLCEYIVFNRYTSIEIKIFITYTSVLILSIEITFQTKSYHHLGASQNIFPLWNPNFLIEISIRLNLTIFGSTITSNSSPFFFFLIHHYHKNKKQNCIICTISDATCFFLISLVYNLKLFVTMLGLWEWSLGAWT